MASNKYVRLSIPKGSKASKSPAARQYVKKVEKAVNDELDKTNPNIWEDIIGLIVWGKPLLIKVHAGNKQKDKQHGKRRTSKS